MSRVLCIFLIFTNSYMYPYFWDKCPIDISMEISNYLKYKHNLKKIDNLDFTIRFSIIHVLICAVL